MPGNALFNLPAAEQVLSRPCSTLNVRYARQERPYSKKEEIRTGIKRGWRETKTGYENFVGGVDQEAYANYIPKG
ncbi:hypothetical protein M0802_000661 [Mischocyttarus mexicanus]|nr:hypothetical protein M0802_000661 [Mischocyttarus mexicanus]